jgi:hypothetical protein
MNALQNEYNKTVNEYQQLMQQFSGSTNSYLSRVSSNNQYYQQAVLGLELGSC